MLILTGFAMILTSKNKKEISYENMIQESNHEKLVINKNYYIERREQQEFWYSLMTEINRWDSLNLKENEKKVVEAIKILLNSAEEIEIFNKKAVYLYLRELTGLNTKQVVNNLNKLRDKYRIFRTKWDRGDYDRI